MYALHRSSVLENVATTQAEYLSTAYDKADAGFDTLTAAAQHATDMLIVRQAYEQVSP